MLYDSERGELRCLLGGDCIVTRPLAVFAEERFLKLREILHGADVRFANFESNVHAYLEGHQHASEGGYVSTEPALLKDLKWIGVNLLSAAGTHPYDYGVEGVLNTMRCLAAEGFVQAGVGRHLREARSPAYLDTARGRVGLVAATAHFLPEAIAGEQRPDALGKPGVNPLRFQTRYVVEAATLQSLRTLGEALGVEAGKVRRRNLGFPVPDEPPDQYLFLGHPFVQGEAPAVQTLPDPRDVEGNLRQIAEARFMADFVIASLHYHEIGGANLMTAKTRGDYEEPADYVKLYAHRCIDAGADLFVGHGPQVPLGIEIYRGKPIFYSLGALIFQLETIRFLPEEAYRRYGLTGADGPADFLKARYHSDSTGHPAEPIQWEQVLADCRYRGGRLTGIVLHPLDLGYGKPRSQRGRPLLAGPELGEKIIARLARLSKRSGVEIEWREGKGIVRLA